MYFFFCNGVIIFLLILFNNETKLIIMNNNDNKNQSDSGASFFSSFHPLMLMEVDQIDSNYVRLLCQKLLHVLDKISIMKECELSYFNILPKTAHLEEISTFLAALLYYAGPVLSTGFTLGDWLLIPQSLKPPESYSKRCYIKRLLYLILLVIAPSLLQWSQRNNNNDQHNNIMLRITQKVFNIIHTTHLACFFWFGDYSNFIKRLLKVNPCQNPDDQNTRSTNSIYMKVLALLLMLQSLILVWNITKKPKIFKKPILKQTTNNNDELNACNPLFFENIQSTWDCLICCNPCTSPTASTCGHVFCWKCILQWCVENPVCPFCRSKCFPQQLLLLHHV